jgi:hypothetical protein
MYTPETMLHNAKKLWLRVWVGESGCEGVGEGMGVSVDECVHSSHP